MSDELVKKETPEVPAKPEETKQAVTPKMVDFGPEIAKLLPSVGTIELTPGEKEILYAPVDERLIEIRSDGIVFLSWMQYITRLRNALGIAWGLIPVGFPKMKGDMILWPFWFIIRGIPVTFVIGEQLWASENKRMSWAEAVEGARSNALMRACKAIGITLELWDKSFINAWKSKYAREIDDPKNKGKKIWVKVMTPEEVVDKTKEVFPGAEVLPGQDNPTGSTAEAPVPEGKSSALLFVEYHDVMVRLNHISALRDYWTKIAEEAEAKLRPNHFKQLVELKTKLRQGFIDDKTKGGK